MFLNDLHRQKCFRRCFYTISRRSKGGTPEVHCVLVFFLPCRIGSEKSNKKRPTQQCTKRYWLPFSFSSLFLIIHRVIKIVTDVDSAELQDRSVFENISMYEVEPNSMDSSKVVVSLSTWMSIIKKWKYYAAFSCCSLHDHDNEVAIQFHWCYIQLCQWDEGSICRVVW